MSGDDETSTNTSVWRRVIDGMEKVVEGVWTIGTLLKAMFNIFD